jgi:hypothetical protein
MIDVVQVGPHLGAEPALGNGVIGIAAKTYGAAILDFDNHTARIRTIMRASAMDLQ